MRALWRYRYFVAGVAVLAAALGYFHEARKPPVYEAVSSIKLQNPYDRTIFRNERGVPFTDLTRYLGSQADLVKSPDVMTLASERLNGLFGPGLLHQLVTAQASTSIYEVSVRARLDDPTKVANVVNAVSEAYREVSERRMAAMVTAAITELDRLEAATQARIEHLPPPGNPAADTERTSLANQLTELVARENQITADARIYKSGIDRIDMARPPAYPISDTPRRTAAIFGLVGFIAALIGAFWRSERVRVIDTGDDAAAVVAAPLLGALPRHATDTAPAAAPVLAAPQSPTARDYEFIASTLSLAADEGERRLVLVTSLDAGRAKSVTALNLALSAAQDQRSVILLDLDPAGVLTSLLGAQGCRGASDVAALSAAGLGFTLGDGSTTPIDGLESFRFVPTGTREMKVRGTAESPQVAKILVQLQQESDLVFVVGPALRESPGGIKLAAAVGSVVLVVPRGTKLDQLRQATALLATARASLVGIVFDRFRPLNPWRRWRSDAPRLRGRQ